MMIQSQYNGICKGCRRPTKVGDRVGYRPGEKGVWCEPCTPPDVRNPKPLDPQGLGNARATASNVPPGVGTATLAPPLKKPQVLGTTALLKAMAQFEEAILERFSSPKLKVTPELEKAWDRYSKLKAHALQPVDDNEGTQMLKQALIDVIKLSF